ncbi:hypothetical protein KCP69_03025 [Salmonella enterica subsp. enterica]|nr:hypothetical protein KCP69_03025 [Salmonella enterica subsp. enterica]
MVQPDICTRGGITEEENLRYGAIAYDKTVQIHVCGGPISQRWRCIWKTAIPNSVIHELHRYALLETEYTDPVNTNWPTQERHVRRSGVFPQVACADRRNHESRRPLP